MYLLRLGTGTRLLSVALLSAGLAACNTTDVAQEKVKRGNTKEYFSEKAYGVAASPIVTDNKVVRKGGGRKMVGRPYKVKGKWYVPKLNESYDKVGYASWYGSAFHGRLTANGEIYDQYHLSAAHPTMPLPSYARVTNLENGSSVVVRVNDRGPFSRGRIMDLSSRTAEMLDMKGNGVAKVRVQYVGPARMDGHDMDYLMASYQPNGLQSPGFAPGGGNAVMVASNETEMVVPQAVVNADPQIGDALALVAPEQTSAAFEEVIAEVVLPLVGPIPMEKPVLLGRQGEIRSGLTLGYLPSTRDKSVPFGAVLSMQAGLTTESVIRSHQRRGAGPK